MSKLNNTGMFEMMRGTPPPTWEQTCLDLDKKLADSRQHITELENRLRALWDKYDGDRKHYMDRIKRLEEALDLVRPTCLFVHHSKKHQHKYNEPCPVVALIEEAKEDKP